MAWFDKIKNAIVDTVSLDVVTATGSIQLAPQDMAGDNFSWEKIGDKVSEKIRAADVKVVAYTHSQWDCDSFMFVKEGLTDAEQKLVEAHAATVDAAHATRREAVRLIKDLVPVGN